ncbi:DegT/DnrJ/EryC1/StrS family aminotransferase [Dyadobacter psychrotolerans]|uniref:DegT/DnrJ/EryC1/StrS family aminotransferase n=1 Tax=Dyadobacter psychrotolerans TaxID=2541721 RepID=A0A4R5DYS6_9BACT|nr:DegT/DnrJ/EryC1/StrS family aminotransferase [Dyadobacter psychrotolerans]TDE16555.1 DegT/DnrJ/EryC1/StrS family aminotransferase [Dyadobacter psychrotolerans]
MINVTKTFLPDQEKYLQYVREIWERGYLTNNGPLLQQLESELKDYLKVDHLYFCGNGTIVLQIAIKALEITGEVITTPFSYCATSNAILWEKCIPVFVDIDKDTFNIDPDLIEASITPATTAILATHVYGNPCDVEKIELIAKKHNLKVVYDAAHAFGVTYKKRSLLSYGDISTCSFHATKVFHTIEGGALISNHPELDEKLSLLRAFGHQGDESYHFAGINGKNSEFHAAMGLCNLPHVPEIIAARKEVFDTYDNQLNWDVLERPVKNKDIEYNYAYYPVVFSSEKVLKDVLEALRVQEIIPRRYFYPSLNTLPFMPGQISCPVSENISERVLCLPLYVGLPLTDVERISAIINSVLAP